MFEKCDVTLAVPRMSGREEQNGNTGENNRQQAGELRRYTTAKYITEGEEKVVQGLEDKTVLLWCISPT